MPSKNTATLPASASAALAKGEICDFPRPIALLGIIARAMLGGMVGSALLSALASHYLAIAPDLLGIWLSSQGVVVGPTPYVAGSNAKTAIAVMLAVVSMLVDVCVVYHIIHDAAQDYRHRGIVCRTLAFVISSLNIIGGDDEKAWSREALDRSRVSRMLGFGVIVLIGLPGSLMTALLPWAIALERSGASLAIVLTIFALKLVVLGPLCIEFVRMGFRILRSNQ